MIRNRTELGDLFPIRVRQMGNKGPQAKTNNLMGNQNQNVEKEKIKSRQTKSFPVRSFTPPRKGVYSTKGHVQGHSQFLMELLLFFNFH